MRSRILAEVVALLAPPACVACRTPLDEVRELLCPACRRGLPWLEEPRCPRCGLPAPCRPCPARGSAFERSWAPLAHDGPARELVAALKFGGALAVADLMAAHIAALAPREVLATGGMAAPRDGLTGDHRLPALVPVPADPSRAGRRGLDQAERLAAALSRRTGAPVARCLRRHAEAQRQVGSPRWARMRRARHPVEASEGVPARAVLVDDVHTTGATLDACARSLRAAGARAVAAVTYTRTLRAPRG